MTILLYSAALLKNVLKSHVGDKKAYRHLLYVSFAAFRFYILLSISVASIKTTIQKSVLFILDFFFHLEAEQTVKQIWAFT